MKIILFTILLSAWIGTGFSQPAAIAKGTTQSIESIKIPDFKDPQAKTYFNWHRNYLQKYLLAVRQNDKAAIKSVFDEGKSKTNEALAVMENAKKNVDENKKVLKYSMQIAPAMREISKSPYVQQLAKEYMKNHK